MHHLRSVVLILACWLFAASAQAAESLRIGVLPIVDTLALHVAANDGHFQKHGLDVTLIGFQSALEKDVAAQAGSLDGHFCEISSVILQRAGGLPFTVIASTSHSGPASRMFGLVTSPSLAHATLDEMKGKHIAISRNTIVDFLTGAFLDAAGKPADFLLRSDIRKIPVRVQMLLGNQIDCAVLPEPLLSIVEEAGGTVLMDDRILSMPLAVVALSTEKATPEIVAAFRAAFSDAARAINENPEQYRELLAKLQLIPPQLQENFRIPPFDLDRLPAALPSRQLFDDYVALLIANGTLSAPGAATRRGSPPPPPHFEDVVWHGGSPKP